jgi:hypothetical protein
VKTRSLFSHAQARHPGSDARPSEIAVLTFSGLFLPTVVSGNHLSWSGLFPASTFRSVLAEKSAAHRMNALRFVPLFSDQTGC